MNKFYFYLIKLRNFYVENFFVNIDCFIKNQKLYFVNYYLGLLLRLIPFILIKQFSELFDYQIIYNLDDIYNITKKEQNKILPVILKFEFNNDNFICNMLSQIRHYNGFIPITFFINNNQLEKCKNISIKYLHKGKIIEKTISVDEYRNKLIYNLFED